LRKEVEEQEAKLKCYVCADGVPRVSSKDDLIGKWSKLVGVVIGPLLKPLWQLLAS
jgi:hypothetical protein